MFEGSKELSRYYQEVVSVCTLLRMLSPTVCHNREQFKYDYEVLQSRLHNLPDRLTHDIMVM